MVNYGDGQAQQTERAKQLGFESRKWGNSGTGLARWSDKGTIEVYDEQAQAAPAAPAAPPASPGTVQGPGEKPGDNLPLPGAGGAAPAPSPTPMGNASASASLQMATDPGAGWEKSGSLSGLRPGLGTRLPIPIQQLFGPRAY